MFLAYSIYEMSVKLLKTSFYFTALSTLASAVNFAFYPVVSHLLSVGNFGDVQLGVSFIMLAASLLTSLSTLALFTTANKKTEEKSLNSIERLVISLSIIIALLTAIFAVPLAGILQLQDATLLYILAFIFILNIPASTWMGSLQGGGQFLASGWISVISALTKLIASFIFIIMGFGAHGALFGIALGSFIMLPLAKILDRSNSIQYKETFGLFRKSDASFFIKRLDLLGILLSLMFVAFIANIDIVAAKILLSPAEAGTYAQLSTVAKIPYFAGISVALVLFERYIRKNISYGLSLVVYACLVATVGSGVIIFSDLLLRVLFNFQEASTSLLIPLVIAFTGYSIFMLYAYQLIAKNGVKRLLILAISSICITILPVTGSHTATDIAYSYMYGVLMALFLSAVFSYTNSHEYIAYFICHLSRS